jgi:hypothetical protein
MIYRLNTLNFESCISMKIIYCIASLLLSINAISQSYTTISDTIPPFPDDTVFVKVNSPSQFLNSLSVPSPGAAGLGKFVDIPANFNNGLPQISIPIATVSEGNLQLPISLQYHVGGVRVSEAASWVGLNWVLNAGGIISRQVRGAPDESWNGGNKGMYLLRPTITFLRAIIKTLAILLSPLSEAAL